jgi:hypothetical protein
MPVSLAQRLHGVENSGDRFFQFWVRFNIGNNAFQNFENVEPLGAEESPQCGREFEQALDYGLDEAFVSVLALDDPIHGLD